LSSPANPNRKIPIVYDASYYGYDLHVPLVDPRLTGIQTFTYSAAATVHRTNLHSFIPSGSSAVSYTPLVHSTDTVLSDLDTGVIYHEANGTAFNQDYIIEADMTAVVHQIQISAAFIVNVSNWVDGAAALSGVQLTLASYENASMPLFQPYVAIYRPSSAFTALAANGAHLLILRDFIDVPFRIRQNSPVTLNIQILTTGTSANDTFQVGIVDMYPVGKSTAAKRLFPSEFILHVHPVPEHIEEVNKWTQYELLGTGLKKE